MTISDKIMNSLGYPSRSFLDQNRETFLNIYSPQSDEDFLKLCFQEVYSYQEISNRKKEVAISIRRAIARLGCINSQHIHAEISFENLELLEFWRSCGDVGFEISLFSSAIQDELGVFFTYAQEMSYPGRNPDLYVDMKISEFVCEFYEWYEKLLIT